MSHKNSQFVLVGIALLLLGGILLFQVFNVPSLQTNSQNKLTQDTTRESTTQVVALNLNTATAEQLMNIEGLGVVKANAIIHYREENGGFSTVEEIMEVSGIGEAIYEKTKNFLCVE